MKIQRIFILYLFIITQSGCKSTVPLNQLNYYDLRYHINNRGFSGEAYDVFENENVISFCAEFKNGVPYGAWQSFGYQGEIIQHGSYTPKTVKDFAIILNGASIKVDRISYNSFYEGDYSILYILLISDFLEGEKEIDDLNVQKMANSRLPKDIQIGKFSEVKYLLANKEI